MDVFISYSSKEYEQARLVNEKLTKHGINTWMAPESLPGGSSYTREIPKAISECKVFLLILSDNAQKSRWVSAEIENAFNKEKIILPFVIERFVLNDEFDFMLSQSQRIYAYENKSKSLEELVGRIKGLLGYKDTPDVEYVDNHDPEIIECDEDSFEEDAVVDEADTQEGEIVIKCPCCGHSISVKKKSAIPDILGAATLAGGSLLVPGAAVLGAVTGGMAVAKALNSKKTKFTCQNCGVEFKMEKM